VIVTNWKRPPYREANPESPRLGIWITNHQAISAPLVYQGFSSLSHSGFFCVIRAKIQRQAIKEQGTSPPAFCSPNKKTKRGKKQPAPDPDKEGLAGELAEYRPMLSRQCDSPWSTLFRTSPGLSRRRLGQFARNSPNRPSK
jgi:hypothetical protein